MATGTSLLRNQGGTSLTTKETNPTETEISQLEVTMLVNERIVRLQITATQRQYIHIQ